MYKNKCAKCGKEFETKNPKRVICPDCLYPDKEKRDLGQKPVDSYTANDSQDQSARGQGFQRPQQPYNQRQSGFQRPQQPYNQGQGNFQRPQQPYNQGQGGFRRPPQQTGRPGFPRRPAAANKKLLISREQVAEIEKLYKDMLPLPNPDCHEVIGEKIELEPNKVFFGINLIRQKFELPRLPYPKRKLAVTTEQLTAIKNLYAPLLPLPPIGCHKIISKQLKMDEWRVHVGIGITRKQMNLPRWNTEREDAPPEFKNKAEENNENNEDNKDNKNTKKTKSKPKK